MNTVSISPEVLDFAAAVRQELSDLSSDEREELVGGLDADLSDLVAERGTGALGDPVEYARELRAAAGLPAQGRGRTRQPLLQRLAGLLDRAHARWDRSVTGLPGGPWELLVSLQPVWWVLRAYVACQTVDIVLGDGGWDMRWVPSLMGWGIPVLTVAVLVSTQIGRGRWWPGRTSRVGERLLLLVLNLFAIGMVPVVSASLPHLGYGDAYLSEQYWSDREGLTNDGTAVTNVFPYDAEGRPLVGVQLYDQDGQPLAVDPDLPDDRGEVTWTYPWTNVNGTVWNTFPMPVAPDAEGFWERMESPWTSTTPPQLPEPPAASVPPASSPAVDGTRRDRATGDRGREQSRGDRRG